MKTETLLPAKADDDFRKRQHAYWLDEAAKLRADGNEELARKCERNAATWETWEVRHVQH